MSSPPAQLPNADRPRQLFHGIAAGIAKALGLRGGAAQPGPATRSAAPTPPHVIPAAWPDPLRKPPSDEGDA